MLHLPILVTVNLSSRTDVQNDVQNLCSTADFFPLKWGKHER